jgi:LPS-assembly protein
MDKGIFTYCKDKGDDSCPPWTLQSNKIKHDLEKKTIYYDNVVLKIYDFPIFYSPKFSHPDPSVDRRSGLLPPSLSNSSTLGSGLKLPYFWNISKDRDLTITPKFYLKENPLILAEYRQDFKNSFLILDTSYTQGFKKKDNKKSDGGRNHFFSKFNLNFFDDNEKSSDLEINLQKVNNDTYFKVHDINTELVQKDQNILSNTLNYTYQNKDFFLGITPSFYEDTTKFGNLRNEYLLPISIEKNLFTSEKLGFLDLTSNLNLRNYETNKQANFFINDLNWKSNSWLNKFGFESYFNALVKTVNYETKKTTEYKNSNLNSELNSVFGYNAKLNLFKKNNENSKLYSLTPKFLLRYAPGHMRNIEGGRLNYDNLYQLNKVDESDVIENGLSSSIGLEFKQNKINNNYIEEEQLSFSIGQVISQKENMDIPSSTSLDQKLSDVVGKANYNINDKVKLNYNFSLDHNYKELNYNEIAAEYNLESVKFNLSYLQEKKHIGNQDLISAGINYKLNNFSELDFSSKRNLITNSAEFYNLSYNYFNDCLKAGITYRREFYTDRDVEPENRLMFTISIIPFAEINSPSISR